MRVADSLEYSTVLPDRLTWDIVREGVNRMRIKNVVPFPDGYFRLYIDQQGMVDLVHHVGAKPWTVIREGVFMKDNVLVVLYENSFLQDPTIPTYLIVTKGGTAELVGLKLRTSGLLTSG